ncbi:hypothetical protein VK70_00930 [Paenibacillus durus ATCC 35681]|uniref:Uncharacterized protein n=1 Tax=Paenibacillus durus ATCC 35681 TaxID=1333534 RepID=A0A0F7F6L8_PAEDU|nr:hypothetical protein VK70_00930 [Paenibacillus durus ATCC 35681]
MFYFLCDEIATLDWTVALRQLIKLLHEIAVKTGKKTSALIKSQLQQSTPAVDRRFAQLHQGLSADFRLRKLSSKFEFFQ